MLRKAKAAGLDVYVAVAPFMPLHGVSELTEVINAVKELKPVEIFCEVLNPRAENLAMMNDALATAGRPERIDAEYQERWARYTHSMLTTVAAECERAGVGDSLIAWPDLKAAKSKKLTETERA